MLKKALSIFTAFGLLFGVIVPVSAESTKDADCEMTIRVDENVFGVNPSKGAQQDGGCDAELSGYFMGNKAAVIETKDRVKFTTTVDNGDLIELSTGEKLLTHVVLPEGETVEEVANLTITDQGTTELGFTYELPESEYLREVNVYRDGELVKNTAKATFTDVTVSPGTTYEYTFKTVAVTGDESEGVTITAETKPLELITNVEVVSVTDTEIHFAYDLTESEELAAIHVYNGEDLAGTTTEKEYVLEELMPNSTYEVTFEAVDKDKKVLSKVTVEATTAKYVERIFGDNRFKTNSAFIEKIDAQTLDSVFIANGLDFPDSLTGAVLNNTMNGAILLVWDNEKVIKKKIAEAARVLKPGGKVYILGGEVAVSNHIEKSFAAAFDVERIEGANRAETAIEVAKRVTDKPTELFITYGMDFADALSITPYATKSETPILLNTAKDKLTASVADYIKANKTIEKVTIIGGEQAVPKAVEDALKALVGEVDRIAGDNRELTALAIAKAFYPENLKMAVANGYDFPDALAGSQFAYQEDMPILLAQAKKVNTYVVEYAEKVQAIYLYGGDKVITNDVKEKLQ